MKDLQAAVQPKCHGKTHAEIEQILRQELSARGMQLPERMIGGVVSVLETAAEIQTYPRGLIGQLRGLRLFLRMIAEAAARGQEPEQ